jgi:hypothetical protein
MKIFKDFVILLLTITIVAILLAWPVQWLWNNALLGAIEGINPIGFWQALGINFLASILFKSTKSSNHE